MKTFQKPLCHPLLYRGPQPIHSTHARILPPTQAPELQPQPALQVPPQRAGSPSNSHRQQLTPSSTTHRAVTSPAAPTQPSRYLHRPDHHNHSIPPPQHQPRLQTQGYQRPYCEGLQYQKCLPQGNRRQEATARTQSPQFRMVRDAC
jgi:hypothetical protein